MATSDDTSERADARASDRSTVLRPTDLLERKGTIPFVGLTKSTDQSYPDVVSPEGERFITTTAKRSRTSFIDAIQVLPDAHREQLFANNPFVSERNNGTETTVDTTALRNVEGLDLSQLERTTGQTVQEMAEEADQAAKIPVSTHRDIVDHRRLALRTLGFDVGIRWQIASDSYNPGDMTRFFREKETACRKAGLTGAFGWVRHKDWGGVVKVTTLYPSYYREIGIEGESTEDDPVDGIDGVVVNNPDEVADSAGTTSVIYGDQIRYNFRGTQRITANPVVYYPDSDVMIPLSNQQFKRRHEGDFMDQRAERKAGRQPLQEWHAKLISYLDSVSQTVAADIVRARSRGLNFTELSFGIQDFYEYLGLPATYAEVATTKVRQIASPSTEPSLWTLQLALKLALLEQYDGAKAGKRYQELQELAGQLLHNPDVKLALVFKNASEDTNEEESADTQPLPEDQSRLSDVVDAFADHPAIVEQRIGAAEASQVQQQVDETIQQRLGE